MSSNNPNLTRRLASIPGTMPESWTGLHPPPQTQSSSGIWSMSNNLNFQNKQRIFPETISTEYSSNQIENIITGSGGTVGDKGNF